MNENAEERVQVTRSIMGICTMQVCSVLDASDEEILAVCNERNPAGTTLGWCRVVRNDEEHPQCNPLPCSKDPSRVHLLVRC